ncbi:MAG: hypothetical protein GC181_08985 [Bacteroidetes bacterium]|nr:hypothetical protein [Bacteroidota bacterium]
MLKKLLFIFFSLWINGIALPQSELYKQVEKDLEIANKKMTSGSPKEARKIIDENLKYAVEHKDREAEVLVLERLAIWYLFTGETDEGIKTLTSGINKAGKLQDSSRLAVLLENRAYEYARLRKFDPAIKDILRAQHIFEVYHDTVNMLAGFNSIGYVFARANRQMEAEPYYQKELEIAKKADNEEEIADALDHLAELHDVTNTHIGLLKNYQLKSIPSFRKFNNYERLITALERLSRVYLKEEKYDSAELRIVEASALLNKINDEGLKQTVNLTSSSVHLFRHQFKKAVKEAKSVVIWAKSKNKRTELRKAYGNLSTAYASLNQFDSAYRYLTLLKMEEDAFKEQEAARKLAELQQQKTDLQEDLSEARSGHKSMRSLMWVAIVLSVFLVLAGGWLVRRKYFSEVKVLKTLEVEQNIIHNETDDFLKIISSLDEKGYWETSMNALPLTSILERLEKRIQRENKLHTDWQFDTIKIQTPVALHYALVRIIGDTVPAKPESGYVHRMQCESLQDSVLLSIKVPVGEMNNRQIHKWVKITGASENISIEGDSAIIRIEFPNKSYV